MQEDSLWIKLHHEYFYEDASLETVKDGIHEAIHVNKIDSQSIYNAVIKGAYTHNRIEILEFIFSQKDFKWNDKALTETLSNTMMFRYFKSAEFLIKKDVKLDLNNKSVLWVLPHCGLELLHLIRQKGYDVYDPQYNLLNLSFKEYPPKYDIVEDILKHGAKFDDIHPMEIYHHLLTFDHPNHIEKIDYMISKGYDINQNNGLFLKAAILNKCNDMLDHLLSIGVDTNFQDCSLFQLAARQENLKLFETLIKHGLKLNPNDNDVIKEAAQYDNLEVVQYLLQKGFNFETAHNFGEEKVKSWCIEQMHHELTQNLPTNEQNKRKSKL
jgi:hypothetical protein